MKKQPRPAPNRSKFSIFRQLCNLIPTQVVAQLARDLGVEKKSRSFKPWSHVVRLLFAQFTHAVGLNDVSDGLRLHSGPLSAIRGATPPSRNGLSTANRERPAALAEQLFWKTPAQQLRAALGQRALRAVVETGSGGAARKLWDSRWRFSIAGPAGSGVFTGLSTQSCGIATASQTPEYHRMN